MHLESKCGKQEILRHRKGLPEATTEVDVSRRANKMMHLKEHNEITAE